MADLSNKELLITYGNYQDMIRRTRAYKVAEGKNPTIIYLNSYRKDYITYNRLKDMYKRVKQYKNDNPKKVLNNVWIKKPKNTVNVLTPKYNNPTINIKGKKYIPKNFTEFYNLMGGFGYSYYYNDIYTLSQEIKNLTKGKAMNCFSGDTQIIIKESNDYKYITLKELHENYSPEDLRTGEILTASVNKETNEIEWKPIIATYYNGIKETFNVLNKVETTIDHEYYCNKGIDKKLEDFTHRTTIRAKRGIKLNNLELNPEYKLLGFILGDGHLNNNQTYIRVKLDSKKKYISKILKECNIPFKSQSNDEMGKKGYTLYSFKTPDYVKKAIPNSSKKNLKVPINEKTILGLISGLVSSDGHYRYASNHRFEFVNTNYEIIELMSICLKLAGYDVSIKSRDTKDYKTSFSKKKIFEIYSGNINPNLFDIRHNIIDKPVNNFKNDKQIQFRNKIESKGKNPVYNLTVLDNHNIIVNGLIINQCTDFAQLGVYIASQFKKDGKKLYETRYVHIDCRSGGGHTTFQIRGGEFKNWTMIDLAAKADKNSRVYPIGDYWCKSGIIRGYNELWVLSDDGKT